MRCEESTVLNIFRQNVPLELLKIWSQTWSILLKSLKWKTTLYYSDEKNWSKGILSTK